MWMVLQYGGPKGCRAGGTTVATYTLLLLQLKLRQKIIDLEHTRHVLYEHRV
jgi:hypothetical protein